MLSLRDKLRGYARTAIGDSPTQHRGFISTMLPLERTARRIVKWNLTRQLTYSRESLKRALKIAEGPVIFRHPPSVPGIFMAVMSLYIRQCRRFGQVLPLSERGQSDGAEVIIRSMFESYLALTFICRPSVKLRYYGSKKKVPTYGHKLTREFRSLLFFAHGFINEEKHLTNVAKVKGSKRRAKKWLAESKQDFQQWKTAIGPEWTAKLKSGNTCSGLSIINFAHSLGGMPWYHGIYGLHSAQTHVGSPHRFLTHQEDSDKPLVHWYDDEQQVAGNLFLANALMGLSVHEFSRLLDPTKKKYIQAKAHQNPIPGLHAAFRR